MKKKPMKKAKSMPKKMMKAKGKKKPMGKAIKSFEI